MKPLPIRTVAYATGSFLAISYLICVLWDLLVPSAAMYQWWSPLLPGFRWLTLQGFLIGLAETFLYGVYAAVVFVPLFNFFNRRFSPAGGRPPLKV